MGFVSLNLKKRREQHERHFLHRKPFPPLFSFLKKKSEAQALFSHFRRFTLVLRSVKRRKTRKRSSQESIEIEHNRLQCIAKVSHSIPKASAFRQKFRSAKWTRRRSVCTSAPHFRFFFFDTFASIEVFYTQDPLRLLRHT